MGIPVDMSTVPPSQYNSLSLDQLCKMFELPEKTVYNLVSRMMMMEELHGSWDQPTRTIVMHNLDASRLQQLAVQFADKAMVMIDLNERALAYRTGGLRDNDDEGGGAGPRGAGGGGAGGRRGPWNEEEGGQGRTRGGVKLAMVRNTAMQGRGGGPGAGGRGGGRGGGDRAPGGYRGSGGGAAGGGGQYPGQYVGTAPARGGGGSYRDRPDASLGAFEGAGLGRRGDRRNDLYA